MHILCGLDADMARFFGSGVILATAIVHLMDPAIKEIGIANTYAYGGCLSDEWGEYPYPVSFPMSLGWRISRT
jgi:zinc transporter 1/2/3